VLLRRRRYAPAQSVLPARTIAPGSAAVKFQDQAIVLFLKRLFHPPRFQAEAQAIFRQIAERARNPILYTVYGVPDTIDGRFEMLCLHAYAVFHGLKGKGPDADALSQATYDAMFADLDGSLRELGVADLGVGRRIKTMTEALNGRMQAYDRGFAAGGDALAEAIRRNVYGTVTPRDDQVRGMAAYLRGIRSVLVPASFEDLCTARIMLQLPQPPASLEVTNATG
jgi:cytochrome b pre-mRNA-processing protein 3